MYSPISCTISTRVNPAKSYNLERMKRVVAILGREVVGSVQTYVTNALT